MTTRAVVCRCGAPTGELIEEGAVATRRYCNACAAAQIAEGNGPGDEYEAEAGCCPECGSDAPLNVTVSQTRRAYWSDTQRDYAFIGYESDDEFVEDIRCAGCGYHPNEWDWE
jgi:hypothetical protein